MNLADQQGRSHGSRYWYSAWVGRYKSKDGASGIRTSKFQVYLLRTLHLQVVLQKDEARPWWIYRLALHLVPSATCRL